MKKFAIIKEHNVKIDTNKLIPFLNSICKGIEFENRSLSNNHYIQTDEIINDKSWEELLDKFDKSFNGYDRILYLTDKALRDNQRNLCYGKDHGESGIFSFYKWESRARNSKLEVPRNNGFIYIICTFIASFINNKFNCKNVNTGCIYDYIHQKYHINTGMIKTHICSDCKKNIKDRNSIEYKTIRKNLDVLMKELSEASSLEMDILDFWSDKTEEELEQLVEGKPSTNKLTEEELNENLEISQLVLTFR